MTQSFPTSAQVIYDVLAADASLVAKLGTYTFKSGDVLPALSIMTPGTDLPMLAGTSGVEVVIHDTGNVKTGDYLSGERDSVTTWLIFVICWKGATGADMHDVTLTICNRFLGSVAVQTVATANGVGALVQTKIQVRSDRPIIS